MPRLKTNIIGVTGFAGSGKDTVCGMAQDLMYERHAAPTKLMVQINAFASPLKRLCTDLYGRAYGVPESAFTGSKADKERELEQLPGWTGRSILQHVGTEGFRHTAPEIWGRYTLSAAHSFLATGGLLVLISDVRFRDEAKLIQDAGGVIVRVMRPSVDNAARTSEGVYAHASEREIDSIKYNYSIDNQDGPLDSLKEFVSYMLEFYEFIPPVIVKSVG